MKFSKLHYFWSYSAPNYIRLHGSTNIEQLNCL